MLHRYEVTLAEATAQGTILHQWHILADDESADGLETACRVLRAAARLTDEAIRQRDGPPAGSLRLDRMVCSGRIDWVLIGEAPAHTT